MDKDRRRIIAGAGAVLAGSACGCALSGCKMILGVGDTPEIPPGAYLIEAGKVRIALDQVPALGQVGGSVKVTDPGLPDRLIVVRVQERDYLAASLKCTHAGRELEYCASERKLRCVSFGHSEFGEDGSLKKGPAKKPLRTYETSLGLLDKNKLIVKIA